MTALPKISTTLWFNKDAKEAAHSYVKAVPVSMVLGVERYGKGGPPNTEAFVDEPRLFV
jgi:predicted 3-demethylubiquinone-9 3-methyltransferase (glyoxalase superfamily)